MNIATIADETNTYEIEFENVSEQPLVNANTTMTIGGVVNSQADSERLAITTTIRIPQSDIAELKAIYTNFNESLRYKPSRLLWDRTNIEEIQVVLKSSPRIENRTYNGQKYFYITFNFEEVIQT